MRRFGIATRGRSHRSNHRRDLSLEGLERREMMSSTGWVPEKINIPLGSATSIPRFDSAYCAQGNAAIIANEIDYYRFRAQETGVYQVSATTPSSNLDTVLGVFDTTGKRLAYNDDIGSGNRDSRTLAMFLRGEEYVFAVTNYTDTPGGSYAWEVRRTDDFYEGFGGDTKATAINLGQLSTRRVQAGLVLADGNDWFQFYLPSAPNQGRVEIRFEHDLGDLDMALYNAAGQQIGWSQGVGDKETLSLVGQPAGQYYYVHVYGHAGASNSFYTLDVNPWNNGYQIDVTSSGFNATQQAMIRQAADQWEQIITGDLPNATFNNQTVDDLLVSVTASAIDGGGNILGWANYDQARPNKGLPYHGAVTMDSADVNGMVTGGDFLGTVVHEMGHILGIGTLWSSRGLLAGAGTTNPRFTGQQATIAYNQVFARNDTGVPVEAGGGNGTALSHWRESELGVEMMTGWNDAGFEPISRITVGSLVDLGYAVNWAAAETFTPPPSFPTGSGWWGLSTQWNPASLAIPSDDQPARLACTPDCTESLVTWNVVSPATDLSGKCDFSKNQGAAGLVALNLSPSWRTALQRGSVRGEEDTALAEIASAPVPRHAAAMAVMPCMVRRTELQTPSNQAWAEAVDWHLRRLALSGDIASLAMLMDNMDLS